MFGVKLAHGRRKAFIHVLGRTWKLCVSFHPPIQFAPAQPDMDRIEKVAASK